MNNEMLNNAKRLVGTLKELSYKPELVGIMSRLCSYTDLKSFNTDLRALISVCDTLMTEENDNLNYPDLDNHYVDFKDDFEAMNKKFGLNNHQNLHKLPEDLEALK